MIQYLLFCAPKLLNISDIAKRIGNFFKLPIQFFKTVLIPNSRYKVFLHLLSGQYHMPKACPTLRNALAKKQLRLFAF